MTSPSILCLGAGAIGSLVSAKLAQAGMSVGLVGRGAHVEAVRRSGLVLEEAGRTVRLAVLAYGSLEEAFAAQGVPTTVVLAVKNFDAGDAAAGLGAVLFALTVYQHRGNVKRLAQGKELRLLRKTAPPGGRG